MDGRTKMRAPANVDLWGEDWSIAERLGVTRGFRQFGYEHIAAGMRRLEPVKSGQLDVRGHRLIVSKTMRQVMRSDYAGMCKLIATAAGTTPGRLSVLPLAEDPRLAPFVCRIVHPDGSLLWELDVSPEPAVVVSL